MKKCIKSMFVVLCGIIVTTTFLACGSDDDGNDIGGGGNSGLVGQWRRVYNNKTRWYKQQDGEWVQYANSEYTYGDEESSPGFIFNSNGTAQLIYATGDGTYELETDEPFKWKTENGHLYLLEVDQGETDGWEDLGTYTLSDSTLEIIDDKENGSEKRYTVERYQKF